MIANSIPSLKLSFYHLLILALLFASCHVVNADTNLVKFSKAETRLIKSLSSQRFRDQDDSSNRVSGNKAAIDFGSTLFFNPKLSGDGRVSCAMCHNPIESWANHNALTTVRTAHPASRHVPSLLGVKYNRWYFWDGRADSLWSQALKPIENIAEMAGSRVQIARLIINDLALRKQYEAIFGMIPKVLMNARLPKKAYPILDNKKHPMNQAWLTIKPPVRHAVNVLFSNIGKSIAAFEETLVSKDSPFDKFANNLDTENSSTAISISAQRGLKLFIGKAACVNCHFGPNFTDGEFHHSFLEEIALDKDLGRYAGIKTLINDPFNGNSIFSDAKSKRNKLNYVYQNVAFRGQFKTPSLRNIAKSYPYMHTGEIGNLYEVLNYYNTISNRVNDSEHQEILLKSLRLSKQEVNSLVEFLKTLSENNK